MENKKYNAININVITLGDCGVGKTSIIKRIKTGKFEEFYSPTVGFDFFVIKRKYEKKSLIISLNFKDTTGQEEYHGITNQYIRDSHIVLLVFSDLRTLDTIKNRWYTFYKQKANIDNSRFILVGNKSDIFGNDREQLVKQGEQFAEEIDSLFLTCSAKSADNMDNLDRYITQEARRFIDIVEKETEENKEKLKKKNEDKINLNKKANDSNKGKSKCC